MKKAAQPFNVLHSLPRMSWRPLNLFNLWRRSLGPAASEVTFTRSSLTLFQQRWRSKRLVRGYHGDYIPEKKFMRWYLPRRLPDVRIRKTNLGKKQEAEYLQVARNYDSNHAKWAGRLKDATDASKKADQANAEAAKTPLGSLMFIEIERRLDTFIFRCCFAPSVYQARQMVIHGKVLLNGQVQSNPNIRLNPGDMVSVDPEAMIILRPQSQKRVRSEEPEAEASTASESSSNSEDDSVATSSPPAPTSSSQRPTTPSKDDFKFPAYAAPFIFVPAYIEANFATCSAVYVRHPTARPGYSEIPTPYDADGEVMRFAWEWYSKIRPRPRGKNSRWKSPELARS